MTHDAWRPETYAETQRRIHRRIPRLWIAFCERENTPQFLELSGDASHTVHSLGLCVILSWLSCQYSGNGITPFYLLAVVNWYVHWRICQNQFWKALKHVKLTLLCLVAKLLLRDGWEKSVKNYFDWTTPCLQSRDNSQRVGMRKRDNIYVTYELLDFENVWPVIPSLAQHSWSELESRV